MTLPAPRLHPDPAPDPATDDGRGDWSWYAVMPIIFAVAGVRGAVRWLRWHVAGWLYAAADAVNAEDEYVWPLATPEARAALTARIMRKVEAEAARIEAERDRGGAT